MGNLDLLAVVVTYNRKVLLRECIEALKKQSYSNFDILIVDNNSTDNTFDYIKDYISDSILYYNTKENLGGAGGFSVGLRYSVEHEYDYCWIMDDDTIPNNDALESLVNNIKRNPNISFLSSLVLWKDGSICKMNRQNVIFDFWNDTSMIRNGLFPIKNASFVSCVFKVEYVRQIGLPYKEFFIYGDDLEYTHRMTKKYGFGYLDINSIVIHKMNNNTPCSVIDCEIERISRYYLEARNIMFWKRKQGFCKFLRGVFHNFRTILSCLFKSKNKRFKRARVYLKGTFAGMFFNPKIDYFG